MRYFLAVAREQSISGAANYLHLSQSTLSRQLKDLEDHFGKQLFIRGNRRITLTEEGVLFCKRAEEITELVKKAENEIAHSGMIAGDLSIGAGETDAIRLIAKAARKLQTAYPQIHYHISSGDTVDIIEQLDKGLIDFGILFDPVTDLSKYDHMRIPTRDIGGVLMRRDSPLAAKETVTPADLWDKPLIISRLQNEGGMLSVWLEKPYSTLNIVATYSLLYNASLMVDEGLGYALCIDRIINVTGSTLCFKPLEPRLDVGTSIVWKKYSLPTKAAEKFLQVLHETI